MGEIAETPRTGTSEEPEQGPAEDSPEASATPADPPVGEESAPAADDDAAAAEPEESTVEATPKAEDDEPADAQPADAQPDAPVDAQPDEDAEARRVAAEQAAADLAEVKRWAAERAAAERVAAEAAETAAAAQAAADEAELERARAEQAAADLAAVREWAAQRAAAEQAAADQAAAERAAVEQAEADRLAAERAEVEQAEAERRAVEQAEADRLAAERAQADQVEAQRAAAAAEMAAERVAIQQEAAERATATRAAALQQAEAAERAAVERSAAERAAAAQKAAAERADVERAQAEWAASRQAAHDQATQDRAAQARAAQDRAAQEQAAYEAQEQAATRTTPTRAERRGASAAAAAEATRGRGGRLAKILVAAVLAVVLVAGGVLLTLRLTGDDGGATVAEDAEQVPDAVLPELSGPSPVLAALSADAPVPDPAALSAVLTPLLAASPLGSGLSAQVVDVATGDVLFDQDATDPSTPASTAKLLTATAALTTLDPADTLTTTVVAGSVPGEVVLVGGGDPTLSTTAPSVDYPGAATVADLAAQVQAALAGQAVTRVVVDNSLFTGPLTGAGWGEGDAPSTYAAPVTATAVDGARVTPGKDQRSGSPGTDAGTALAAALGVPDADVALGTAPPGARTLGTVESAPIERLVEQALNASDNLLAEDLGRQVAIARGLPATFDGAAQGITAALAEAGLDTTGLDISDASGLATDDRVPARLLVDVLRGAADGSVAGAGGLLSGLPVAGYDGTLAERTVEGGDAGPGSVRAKTGTLLGTNDLAGTVLTADGRLLAFAVMADGTVGGLTAGEGSLDVIADALAGCGCR